MASVIMTCGRICSGKSTYAERLRRERGAVLLSIDEIMLAMFGQYVGEMHDEYVARTEKYLFGKALEIAGSGINVVLDWGVWTKAERAEAREFFTSRGIDYELHYLDVPDSVWRERIAKRNLAVSEGRLDAYYIDEDLAAKFGAIFEPPTDDEIDKRIPAYETRRISGAEVDAALELASEVFMEFEAPDYTPEGVEAFGRFIRDETLINGYKSGLCPIYGAFDGERLIGVMGMRASKTHINLVFVKKEYHRRGVATAMFNYLTDDLRKENPSLSELTLNSSPYGLPFYRRLGFAAQSEEQEKDGIRFTPMKYSADKRRAPLNTGISSGKAIIRPMTTADYDAVYALWLSCAGMGLNDLDDSRAGIQRFLAQNPETCFIAEENGKTVGVIIAGNDGRRGYVYHTAVVSDFRGKGIARALVNTALDALKGLGINKTALVVFDRNADGNAFWEKLGFTARGDLVYRNKALTEMIRIDT